MRTSRLRACRTDEGHADFVAAFEARHLTASPSRLSRWEYGNSGASCRLLRAYEVGACLPPYLLFATNDRQRRATEDTFASAPTVDPTAEITAEDTYAILDRVVLGHDLTGSDWYALAAFSALNGYFYLSPDNTRLIARRLLEELARSIGHGYILRFEALHLFATMPRVDAALIAELSAMIGSAGTGAIGDAASLVLRASPDAGRDLARKLLRAGTPAAQESATWIEDILQNRLPPSERPLQRSAVVACRDQLVAGLPSWATAHVESEVAQPLLETALAGRSRLQRHEASLLLMTSGVQENLSSRILDAFESHDDPVWRTRLVQLHEYLIPPDDPGRIERLALAESEPENRRALWNARAHVPVPLQPGPPLLEQLRDPTTQGPITSALGLTGSVDDALLARPDLVEVQAVLAWWRQRGPAITA
ncbi:MAG: hypothetical protein NTV23_10070 [Propionibacteriales bacterium]|nr:hypothetical protein [Propionibacteriales bacterium]